MEQEFKEKQLKDEEILRKVIDKAKANGLKWPAGDFSSNDIIFSHDFARALWGESWDSYLQKLAISDDRIEYLSRFI